MADLSYTVSVDTGPAQRNLNELNNRIGTLTDRFNGLRSAIAGLAIGAAITNVVRMADAIQDVSDATGIAVENILGFEKAVKLNGGSAEAASTGIQKLVLSIGEAADGSQKAQSAFNEVGVTLQDLRTLSEQDILAKTIQGLSKIDDFSKRATLTTDLLGKAFRGVNVKGVADQLDGATRSAKEYADAIRQTADMQNKLDIAAQRLQLSILKAIQPMVDFINSIDQEKLEKTIDALVKLGAALGALAAGIYIVEKIGKGFLYLATAIGGAWAAAKLGVVGMIGGFLSLGTTIGKSADSLSRWWRQTPKFAELGGRVASLGTLFKDLGARIAYLPAAFGALLAGAARLVPIIAALSVAVYALDKALDILTGRDLRGWFDTAAAGLENFVTEKFPKVAAALNKLNDMLGMGPPPSVAAKAKAEHDAEMARLKARADALAKANQLEEGRREVIDRNAQELARFGSQLKQQNADYEEALDKLKRQYGIQAQTVTMGENEAEITRVTNDLLDEKLSKQRAIQQEIDKLTLEKSLTQDAMQVAQFDKKLELLRQQKVAIDQIYAAQSPVVLQALKAAQAERDRLADALRYQKFTEELQKIRTLYAGMIGDQQRISDMLEYDLKYQIRKLKMTEDEIELADALNAETQRYIALRDDLDKKLSDNFNAIAAEQNKLVNLTGQEKAAAEDRIALLKIEGDEIRALIDKSYQLHTRNGQALEDNIKRLQTLRNEEKQRVANLEYTTKLIEMQYASQLKLEESLRKINDQKIDLQFEESIRKLSPLQQEIAKINEKARKSALDAGRAFADTFEEGEDGLTPERAQQLADGLQLIAERYKGIASEQIKQLEHSRTWEAGWKDAFDKYMDNATNAATRAGEVFNTITRGMESAIDRFVETGKFSFKDFARSIIQDLIKIELKAQATQLLKMIGGSGSIFSAIGSLFGFAEGGSPPINKPSIVGEKGPEIFVPKQAGTVIPNNLAQGAMNALGAGAVSAPVTNNYITNNISALDAKSVAELFAANRKTLLGTVEMARKEMPYMNR